MKALRITVSGLLILGLMMTSSAFASSLDGCDCNDSEFRGAESVLALSEQIADLGFSAALAINEGRADELLSENLSLKLKSQRRIPRHCRSRLAIAGGAEASKLRVQFATQSRPAVVENTESRAQSLWLLTVYRGLNRVVPEYCTSNSLSDQESERCIASLAPMMSRRVSQLLQKGPSGGPVEGLNSVELRVLRAYDRFIGSEDGNASLKKIRSGAIGLETFEEKQLFLQMVGLQLAKNYDYSRTDLNSPTFKGVVSNDQLLSSMRTDSRLPGEYFKDVQFASKYKARSGVCRDIHSFQAEIAKALGMKNVFVVSFATQGSGHATVSYQIPGDSDPTRVYRLNYSALTSEHGVDGASVVTQQSDDVATYFHVHDEKGRFIQAVPSSLGRILQEGAGFTESALRDRLSAQKKEALVHGKWVLSADIQKQHSLTGFAGKTQEGVRVAGLGYHYHRKADGNLPSRVGVSLSALMPEETNGESDLSHSKGAMLLIQTEQKVQTDRISVSPNVELQVGGAVGAEVTGGLFSSTNPSSASLDRTAQGALRVGWETIVRTQTEDGKYRTRTVLGQTSALGQTNIRDAAAWGLEWVSSHIQSNHSLEVVPDLSAFAELTLIHSELSDRARLEAGVSGARWVASASASGRIDSDSPLLEDQSLRRLGGQLGFRPSEDSRMTLGVETPLEGESRVLGTQINAGVLLNF